MSLVVVIAVAAVVFLYVRMVRRARQDWLARLDLPGRWQGQLEGGDETDAGAGRDVELVLQGRVDQGEFVLTEGSSKWRGTWQLHGHEMHLSGEGRQQVLDLHFFKPGSIGLEDSSGARRLYTKATTNVVPLRNKSGPVSRQRL